MSNIPSAPLIQTPAALVSLLFFLNQALRTYNFLTSLQPFEGGIICLQVTDEEIEALSG